MCIQVHNFIILTSATIMLFLFVNMYALVTICLNFITLLLLPHYFFLYLNWRSVEFVPLESFSIETFISTDICKCCFEENNAWDWFTNIIRNCQKNNIDLNVVFEGAYLFPGYSRGAGKIWNLNNSTKIHDYYFKFSRQA